MNFTKIIQIGILTDDVDKYVENYKKFGMTEWKRFRFDKSLIPNMTVNGVEDDLVLEIAMFEDEYLQLELIQPVTDSVFMDWVKEHGTGIHHLAFVPAEGYDKFMDEYQAMGGKSLIDVLDGTKSGGFSYLDTKDLLGFYSEIHKPVPPKTGRHQED
ncbi:MAG: VOC family protein [Blautia sp.]|nr:VOC family protein [Blautia sp.]